MGTPKRQSMSTSSLPQESRPLQNSKLTRVSKTWIPTSEGFAGPWRCTKKTKLAGQPVPLKSTTAAVSSLIRGTVKFTLCSKLCFLVAPTRCELQSWRAHTFSLHWPQHGSTSQPDTHRQHQEGPRTGNSTSGIRTPYSVSQPCG